jgi:tetratricopeptide (TPR) repeat protein
MIVRLPASVIRLGLILLVVSAPMLRAEMPLAAASALYAAQDYAAARSALEQIVAHEPENAAACHLLGMCLRQRGDARALDDAHPWLEKAAELAPANPEFQADLAGNCLELADLHWSYGLAVRGRDLMEKALRMDPGDLGGREGLMRFYREAPWPLGNREKAQAQAAEIARRDQRRGTLAAIYLQRLDKNYSGAFALALAALPAYPDDYRILFEVGRGASLAGEGAQVDAGIAALQRCLRLKPPMDAPGVAVVDYRLGTLWAKKGDLTAARAAYAAALQRDPANEPARRALAQLP